MTSTKLVLSAVAALSIGIAAPALAQTGNGSSTTTSGNNSATTSVNVAASLDKTVNVNRSRNSTRTTNASFSASDSSQHNNSSQRNGNIALVADQDLDASITNRGPMNFNGNSSNYSSGSNNVGGSAYAAYSGILNQGWNTGVNSNAQAATNIAAQGTTSFTTH